MTAIYSSTGAQTAALRGPTSQSNLFYKVKSHKNKSFTFELLLFRLYKNTNYSNLLLYRGPDRSSKGPNLPAWFIQDKSHKCESFCIWNITLKAIRMYENTNDSNLLLYEGPDQTSTSKGPNIPT